MSSKSTIPNGPFFLISEEQLVAYAKKALELAGVGEKDTYSAAEAAKKLGISECTVIRRVQAGLIRKVPNLHKTRISHAELNRLLGKE